MGRWWWERKATDEVVSVRLWCESVVTADRNRCYLEQG